MKDNTLIKVENLSIGFARNGGIEPVVNHVSFSLEKGEILGIVGESGSGKTMSSMAIMGLLPQSACILGGKILFNGTDLLSQTQEFLREMKGSQIAMIFQEPMTSFNPTLTIGEQIEEMLRLHQKLDENEYKERTRKALEEVELKDAEVIYHKYPHQLSGGMRQRAMIAMAMIAGPQLIIADEPTTALDVTIQAKILELLKKINRKHGTGIILVSHDLGVIKSICKRAVVMKDGSVVEIGKAGELFLNPKMQYTKELVAAAPATWFQDQIRASETSYLNDLTNTDQKKTSIENSNEKNEILHVSELNVYYHEKGKGLFTKKNRKQTIEEVSFSIKRGEAFGIVGESGSGKTTLAKAICGLMKDVDGKVKLYGSEMSEAAACPLMVFQDPYTSLNPAKKIRWILEEPLKIKGGMSKRDRHDSVIKVIHEVGLTEEYLERYVSQLSGGQRQRIAIAVALICKPELIVLDEPVSSLDVTVQAQILELLKKLQKEYGLSYLFISHDLNVIYQLCDRVAVMYQGRIIEMKETKELFHNPEQEYSKLLLEASILR